MDIVKLTLQTHKPESFYDITAEAQEVVAASRVRSGICFIYVPHTTAAVTINEHADPDVVSDLIKSLGSQVPSDADYRHLEGNSPGHIKASLIGSSQMIFIADGRLVLGTWQGIFFCEFDGPRTRNVLVKIQPD
jgi:secondary thiamine-phosphate synthase enzyme